MAGFSHLLHCLEQITASVGNQRSARGIEPTSILQLVFHVETKKIGRALSIIGTSDFLRRIDHVWEDKAVPRGECLHVVERVLGYASVSFGMIAIVPMPIARRRRTHR